MTKALQQEQTTGDLTSTHQATVRSPVSGLLLGLIFLTYVAYAGAFIYKTSFVVDGTRYFCLADDAMISMCYARNLANGDGLVWFPGAEKVEGFTNPLWVLYMALLHLLPVAPAKVSLLVQLTGAACLAANLFLVKKITELVYPGSILAWVGSCVLTAFYLPLNNWALQGMEVGLLALLVSVMIWQSLDSMQRQRIPKWLYGLMGISLLIRIDMVVPCLVVSAFLLIADSKHRWRHCGLAVVAMAVGLGLQTALRLWYFGDFLPNTYYLKMTGYPTPLRIARGLLVMLDFVGHFNWLLFLLPLSLLIFRPSVRNSDGVSSRGNGLTRQPHLLLILVFAGQVAYSVYTGGDAWEWWGGSNRFLAIAMPMFFVLLSVASETILARLGGSLEPNDWAIRSPLRLWQPAVMCLTIIGTLLNSNALTGPDSWSFWRLEYPPLHVEHNRQMVQRARIIQEVTAPDAKVALQWAGIIPYFCNREAIDLLGKNDRLIAHMPMHRGPGLRWFYPGHLKWDLDYSIGELQPDVMEQPWTRSDPATEKQLANYREIMIGEVGLLVRKGSTKVSSESIRKIAELPAEKNKHDFATAP